MPRITATTKDIAVAEVSPIHQKMMLAIK